MDQAHLNSASAFIRACASINFGRPAPREEELAFYRALNEAMVGFIRGLPAPMRPEAMLFCMRYAGINIGDPLDFFRNYHAPVWSAIYWIAAGRIESGLMRDGITAHAMAMLLHSLDDHLADGEMPATHLSLLIRSQAWLVMQEALARFGGAVDGGADVCRELIDDYYAGISDTTLPGSIDEYRARFRKQMATGLIVPHLTAMMAKHGPRLATLVRSAGESFGVAWRFLDDIQDLGEDIRRGRCTAVYCLLPGEGRVLWDSICSDTGACAGNDSLRMLVSIMRENGTVPAIVRLVLEELERAAGYAEEAGLGGLAGEYQSLSGPVAAWVSE
jgi:hypothetical protein